MVEPKVHPTPESLSAYGLGQLPPKETLAVESHISECGPCCETMLGLKSDDTFIEQLKEANQSTGTGQTVHNAGVQTNASRSSPDVPDSLSNHPRYEVVRLIGMGGMGDVYEAKHRMMDRRVALKIIKREFIQKPEAVARFHREVKAAAQLSHPNIVTAYDAEQAGDVHYLVMEYVEGTDLSRMTQEHGRWSIAEACDAVRQAAIGMQHAHECGMVHRDIKPHNLMITADGTVKILDFGLASLAPEPETDIDPVEGNGELTAAGSIMGTPDFISPEQADDARQADIRSDIYSLGATLYFLLSGQPPFSEDSVMKKLQSHAEVEPESLTTFRKDIPNGLDVVVSRMMAKDPAERFQTPLDVAEALDSFSPAANPDRNKQPRPVAQQSRQHSRFRALTAVATLILATVFAAVVYYVQTDNGMVRVTVADESLAVAINGQTITMQDGDKQLKIATGEQTLTVRLVDSDFQFETDRFQIRRNGKIAFKVERLDGEVVVRQDGKPFKSMTLPKETRSIKLDFSPEVSAILAKTGQSEAAFQAKLSMALSKSAGIPNEQWEKLAMNPVSPTVETIVGDPLSIVLLAHIPAPDGFSGLQTLTDSPNLRDLNVAIAPSQEHGYVSIIQPDYIKTLALEFDAHSKLLRGTVHFEAPKLYLGNVNFGVQYHNGRLKVVEFSLPNDGLKVALDEKDIWRLKGQMSPQVGAHAKQTAGPGPGKNARVVEVIATYNGVCSMAPTNPKDAFGSMPNFPIYSQADFDNFVSRIPADLPSRNSTSPKNNDPLLKTPGINFSKNMVLVLFNPDTLTAKPKVGSIREDAITMWVEVEKPANSPGEWCPKGMGTYTVVVIPFATRIKTTYFNSPKTD